MDISANGSYSIDGVVVVAVSSCGVMIFAVMFYFWQFFSTVDHYSHGASFANSDLLYTSVWCITAAVIVAAVAYLLRSFFMRFVPSYLLIPIGSAVFFTVSSWCYLYWVAQSRYSAGDPFLLEPPSFASVMLSALFACCVISALSVGVSSLTFAAWQTRVTDSGIHLS